MNGDWYPEGNIGSWNTSDGMKKPNFREDGLFHDIREWMFNNVIDDSLMNIPDYVATCVVKGKQDAARVSDASLSGSDFHSYANELECANTARQQRSKIKKGTKEWQCMKLDLEASAALGHYYSKKIEAATDLMAYLATGDEAKKAAAVKNLENARDYWKLLAKITKSHYVTHEVWLVGQFDWGMYLPDVEKDIDIAQTDEALDQGRAEVDVGRWQEHRDSRRAGGPTAGRRTSSLGSETSTLVPKAQRRKSTIPAGSWVKTTLNADSPGIAVVRLSGPAPRNQSQCPRAISQTRTEQYIIVADLQRGGNDFAVQYEKESHALPSFELENAPAPIFLEAEEGQLTPPMQKVARRMPPAAPSSLLRSARAAAKKMARCSTTAMQPIKSTFPRTATTA